MLPNFLIIGAMKAGTTSLYRYLREHPQVFMAETKEIDFFAADEKWSRGRKWYERHFEGAGGATAIGEASTSYTKFPQYLDVPQRIAQLLPDVRLIYLVRDPLDRMRSEYMHELLKRREHLPIDRAVLARSRYLCTSLYSLQIELYLELFGADRLLVLESDALRKDRRATLRRVCNFLEVDGDWEHPVLDQEFHTTRHKRMPRPIVGRGRGIAGYEERVGRAPRWVRKWERRLTSRKIDERWANISEDTERALRDLLSTDVERLRRYLGGDFDGWGTAEAGDSLAPALVQGSV